MTYFSDINLLILLKSTWGCQGIQMAIDSWFKSLALLYLFTITFNLLWYTLRNQQPIYVPVDDSKDIVKDGSSFEVKVKTYSWFVTFRIINFCIAFILSNFTRYFQDLRDWDSWIEIFSSSILKNMIQFLVMYNF
jgi:hypothetical protein